MMDSPASEIRKIVVSGTVQGVFFRKTTLQFATALGLCGYVKNLPNGDVEILAQGAAAIIELLLNQLRNHYGSNISGMDDVSLPKDCGGTERDFDRFEIRY